MNYVDRPTQESGEGKGDHGGSAPLTSTASTSSRPSRAQRPSRPGTAPPTSSMASNSVRGSTGKSTRSESVHPAAASEKNRKPLSK